MKNSNFVSILVLVLFSTGLVASCSQRESKPGRADAIEVTVYKNPGCVCCSKWADRLEENGFEVTQEPTPTLPAVKAKYDVPYDLESCHTAIIGDYVVEGHVPVEDIRNLLAEQPDAIGIAVPGMPTGSPGMEVPGRAPEPYKVFLFKEDGTRQVYAQH